MGRRETGSGRTANISRSFPGFSSSTGVDIQPRIFSYDGSVVIRPKANGNKERHSNATHGASCVAAGYQTGTSHAPSNESSHQDR